VTAAYSLADAWARRGGSYAGSERQKQRHGQGELTSPLPLPLVGRGVRPHPSGATWRTSILSV
jgi:hypothetical protein